MDEDHRQWRKSCPAPPIVARITVAVLDDGRPDARYYVTVSGPLDGRDLRRLERACSKALEHRTLPLEIHMDSVHIDPAAQFFLEGLRARGAVVVVADQNEG
jgi:hypothetical protein